jgi:hypothetical protein
VANAANNYGLNQTDPGWNISTVSVDPFGNSWGSSYAGIMLDNGSVAPHLTEQGFTYHAYVNTLSAVSSWTVFAYDYLDGYWLTQNYGATVGFVNAPQVPEPGAFVLVSLGIFVLVGRRRRAK